MKCAVLPSAFLILLLLAGQTACSVQRWRGDCMKCAVLPLPYFRSLCPGGGKAKLRFLRPTRQEGGRSARARRRSHTLAKPQAARRVKASLHTLGSGEARETKALLQLKTSALCLNTPVRLSKSKVVLEYGSSCTTRRQLQDK